MATMLRNDESQAVKMMSSRRPHRLEEKYEEVNQLISVGKEKGYLDYEDVSEILPEELASSDELDEVSLA